MICLGSEARHLKQRPFSGLVINVNRNTGAGYSPIISVHCVNVAISKTSITFKSVFFIRCRRSDSSIFVDKWNLTAATIARSFSQRPQAAIRQLRTWPRIHVQPRFQWGFRNGVTFLRVVYGDLHTWWRHKWKHFPRYWPFVQGIHRSPINSPLIGQWRGALVYSLIRAWINRWVNNHEAGDLRRHRAYYDVIVINLCYFKGSLRVSKVKLRINDNFMQTLWKCCPEILLIYEISNKWKLYRGGER